MSQSWLADECRCQAVLYLVTEAFQAGHRCPQPLVAEGSLLQRRLREEAVLNMARTPRTAAISANVDAIFREHADQENAGIPGTGWQRATLVSWWLEAGKSLGSLERQHREAVDRLTRGSADPSHPALWCAERGDRFALTAEGFAAASTKGDWCEPASGPGECRKKLFVWVMSPDRHWGGVASDQDVTAWFERLRGAMRDIVDDAIALFGKSFRLRSGGRLTLATSDKWIARWMDLRVGDQALNEIRQPVIYPSQEGTKVLVKGVALVQPPQTLIADVAKLQEEIHAGFHERGVSLQSLARATDFARSRWQPGEHISKLWGKAGESGLGTMTVETVERAFLAVGRWLAAAWVVAESDGPDAVPGKRGESIEAMRIALALEGFRAGVARGGAAPTRCIPHASRRFDERPCLMLSRQSPAFQVELGCLDEPASCPAALFAAIEAVDWRIWALGAAPWDLSDDLTRRFVEWMGRPGFRSDAWETIKRQALGASGAQGDADGLSRLYAYANQTRMALESFRAETYGEKPGHGMLEGLIQECRDLARESLRALAASDSAALRRLEPPRREDGAIDLVTWLAQGGPLARQGAEANVSHRLRWAPSTRPRGELLEERLVGPMVEVVVSAGEAMEAELAVLNAPPLSTDWHPGSDETCSGDLAERLAALRVQIAFPTECESRALTSEPIAGLRTAFEGEAQAAFHELIMRCRAGDANAIAWLRLMNADARFGFACHPEIDPASGALQPPGVDDVFLTWEFDATVPAGKDLAVRFAVTPVHARRVISLGPRRAGTVADRAEALATTCRQAGGRLARLGDDARAASHRWATFGGQATHPLTAAEPLLEELLRREAATPASRTSVFHATAEWCESLDHVLLPAEWRAEERLQPVVFADLVLPTEFDDEVPTGAVAVHRFGLRGLHGWPLSGVVSAGPAPSGYREFRAAVETLGNALEVGHTPPAGDLVRRTHDLAKHALSGTLPLALPNLFDCFWETLGPVVESGGRTKVEAAATPLVEMLKVACRMIPFEPSRVGEYPAAWIREADGVPLRGRRIKRIVRPGLRTIENVLVRPALVITE